MRRDDSSPEAYREAVAGEQRQLLESIRATILDVAPGVEEAIGHGMLDYPGLANLAAQKHHVSLYVLPAVLAKHRDAFAGISCGKSCLRFRRLDQLDTAHLRELLSDVLEARRDG